MESTIDGMPEERPKIKYVIKDVAAAPVNEGLPRMDLFLGAFKPVTKKPTVTVPSGKADDRPQDASIKKADDVKVKIEKGEGASNTGTASTSAATSQPKSSQSVKVEPTSRAAKEEPLELKEDNTVDISLTDWMDVKIPANLLPPKPENCHPDIQAEYEDMISDVQTIVYMMAKLENNEDRVNLWNNCVNRWGTFNDVLRTLN